MRYSDELNSSDESCTVGIRGQAKVAKSTYQCTMCDTRYVRQSRLRIHQTRVHNLHIGMGSRKEY